MHSLRLTSNVKTILPLPFARKERFRGPVWPTAPGLGESAPPALPGRAALTLPPSRHTYGGVLAEPSYNNKKPGRGQFFRGNDQGKRTSFLAMRRFSSPASGRIRRLQRPCRPPGPLALPAIPSPACSSCPSSRGLSLCSGFPGAAGSSSPVCDGAGQFYS